VFGQASFSPGVSPAPSDCMVVPVTPSRLGPSRPPSVLGVKRSPPPASPSPPSSPPVLPSSPPPRQGTPVRLVLQDWRDWIAECRQLAGQLAVLGHVSKDDLQSIEGSLLRQVENAGPSSILTLALAPAPTAVPPACPRPPTLSSSFNYSTLPLFSAPGVVAGWRQVNQDPPFDWAEHDGCGLLRAGSNFASPFDRPHPHWPPPGPGDPPSV